MKISGSGITTDLNFKILSGFKPTTKPALKWKQLANGSYIVIDRKKECDIYECAVTLHGKRKDIDGLVMAVEDNRRASHAANEFFLSEFNDSEKIFGAEIDYSSPIRAMVMKMGEVEQKSWRGFSVKVTLRALDICADTNIAPEFPQINKTEVAPAQAYLSVGYTADSETDIQKGDTYTGEPNIADLRGDSGFFEGTFTLKTDDMARLRKFLLDNRGKIITSGEPAWHRINDILEDDGLFGKRRNGDFNVRIREWSDMGMRGLNFWQIKMKFVEEVGAVNNESESI